MHRPRLFAATAAITASAITVSLSPAVVSQSATFEPALVHESPVFGHGPVQLALAANLFGDGTVDCIGQDAQGLFVCYGPGRYEAAISVPATVDDLTVLGNLGSSAASRAFTVAGGRLYRWTRDQDTLVSEEVPGTWSQARSVDAWSGGGGIGFVTVRDADGSYRTVLVTTGSGTVLSPFSTLTGASATSDFLLCDLDGDGVPELVEHGPDGIAIRDLETGQGPEPHAVPLTGSRCCILAERDSTVQRVACASVDGAATTLRVLSATSLGQPVALPDPTLSGIAAGYLDDDDLQDVCVTTGGAIRIALATAGGTAFQLSATPLPQSCQAPASGPCVADFDGDGDDDVLVVHPGCSTSDLHPNRRRPASGTRMALSSVLLTEEGGRAPESPGPAIVNRSVVLEVARPELDPELPFTHIEILVWRAPATPDTVEDPVPFEDNVHNWIVPFPGWGSADVAEVEFELDATVGMQDELFYLELRLFAEGVFGATSPSQFYVGTWQQVLYDALDGVDWTGDPVPTEVTLVDPTREIGGGVRIIHFRPRPSFPLPEPLPAEEPPG